MKTSLLVLFAALIAGSLVHAEDKLADQLRRAFDKAKVEAKDLAEKANQKGREWYHAAKENLRLSRPEYTKRAEKELGQLEADVLVLREMANAPGQRDYFKTRVAALDQHVLYAKNEMKTLQESDSDAVFRARQSVFNKTLWTLEAAVEQAQEEAGL
jgi:hypothetical protein